MAKARPNENFMTVVNLELLSDRIFLEPVTKYQLFMKLLDKLTSVWAGHYSSRGRDRKCIQNLNRKLPVP